MDTPESSLHPSDGPLMRPVEELEERAYPGEHPDEHQEDRDATGDERPGDLPPLLPGLGLVRAQ
jgi:hypothetical protein